MFLAIVGLALAGAAELGGLRAEVRALVEAGLLEGKSGTVYVRMLGRQIRAKAVRPAEGGVVAEFRGQEFDASWDDVKDASLLRLAKQVLPSGSAREYFILGRFASGLGKEEDALDLIERAVALDPSLEERARPYLPAPEPLPASPKIWIPKRRPRKKRAAAPPADLVLVEAGSPAGMPDWARSELELFAAFGSAVDSFLEKFTDKKTGAPCVKVDNAGTADDIVEGVATWDKYLLLAGTEEQKAAYVNYWKAVYEGMRKVRGNNFRSGYYSGGYDAEHAGELLQMLWGALEVAPDDKELIEQNKRAAEKILNCVDPRSGVFRSLWLNARGGRTGGKHGGKCSSHDFVYLNSWFHAYMTTGDERYRQAVFRFFDGWNVGCKKNSGIYPCILNTDLTVPPDWWEGIFSFKQWGLPGVSQRGWHAAATMVVLLSGGKTDRLDGLMSTVRTLFEKGSGGRPATSFDGKNWGSNNEWQLTHVVERMYDLTWSTEAGTWVKSFGSRYGKYFYFGSGDLGTPAREFRERIRSALSAKRKVESAKRNPRTGDELTELAPKPWYAYHYIDGNFWSIGYDNGRTGGCVNNPVRYFQDDYSVGLPPGVAAVVRHVEKDAVRLALYNANPEPARLIITGGHYGTHRIDSANGEEVGAPRVLVELPANAGGDLSLAITRCVYRPTHLPQRMRGTPWPAR